MAESTSVLVPRRAGDEWRDRLWEFCRAWWIEHGMEPIEGHHDDGPFNRSAAVNTAAVKAPDAGCLVVVDADALPRAFSQVEQAAALAIETGKLVRAYENYQSLDRRGTKKILDGHRGSWRKFVRWENPDHLSSCIAVPRSLWDDLGGFDERFVGWGFEDRAFFEAASRLADGTLRVAGDVFHLWHPRSPEKSKSRPEYVANAELASRYRSASPAEMRELLAEAR